MTLKKLLLHSVLFVCIASNYGCNKKYFAYNLYNKDNDTIYEVFSKSLQRRIEKNNLNLAKVQFYISDKLVLKQTSDSEICYVRNGVIHSDIIEHVNEITIPKYTKCICEKIDKDTVWINCDSLYPNLRFSASKDGYSLSKISAFTDFCRYDQTCIVSSEAEMFSVRLLVRKCEVFQKDNNAKVVAGRNAPSFKMPYFNFPPPKPSGMVQLPSTFLKNCVCYSDVSQKLENALEHCNYNRRSFFSCPGGFAVATDVEEINSDGSSKPNGKRWGFVTKGYAGECNGIWECVLAALGSEKPSLARCIVFIVSDLPFNTSAPAKVGDLTSLIDEGTNRLSSEFARNRINNNFSCTALIYEVRKLPSGNIEIVTVSEIDGKTHLIKSQLDRYLGL